MSQDAVPHEPVETADSIELAPPQHGPPEDPLQPQRSSLPPVEPPRKLPVMGVPTDAEAKPVDSEHTRFRGRSKYRAWA